MNNIKKVILILGGIIVAAVMIFAIRFFFFSDFDAQGYVEAVLDQNFKGEIKEVSEFVEDKSKDELKQQYEESVRIFAENNITNGIEMDEELKEQYIELCKKIFESMEYDVKEAEKISRKEYHVTVEYQASDVFHKFSAVVPEESARILEKVNKGEYKGTEEEINQQMQKEFLDNCYNLLEKAYQEMEYAEIATEVFVIKRNSEGLFEIDDAQMNTFVKKIMSFDTNQD